VTLIGAVVLAGWAFNLPALKSISPHWVSMKANTAFGFLLCGPALWLATARTPVAARWFSSGLAVTVIGVGLVTLVEYLTGWNARVDQLIFPDTSIPQGDSLPARMSPASAFCFIMAGSGILPSLWPRSRRTWHPLIGALASTLMTVGIIGILGFLIDGLFAVHWWNYTGMAFHTAAAFGLFGAGLLILMRSSGEMAWWLDRPTTEGFRLGLVTLLAGAGISYHFAVEFQQVSAAVSHIEEVLKELEGIDLAVVNLQAAQRAFITTGELSAVAGFGEARHSLQAHLDNVGRLTATDPRQQRNVTEFQPAVLALLTWDDHTLDIYRTNGAGAAAALLNSGAGTPFGRSVRIRLAELRQEEYRVLGERQAQSYISAKNMFLVMPLGTIFSLGLISLGLFFLNSSAGQRGRYQRQLEVSLAEIQAMKANLEVRVAERTAELETANRELEAFSYSVSHDLRAPLRAVDGFSQALIEDFAPVLPPDGQRQLGVIRASAQRMGNLIDDLLMFSRLGRQPINPNTIETAALVRSVLAELKPLYPGRTEGVEVGSLPATEGDSALLRQVWVNLISNALKYSGKREGAKVEIGYFERDGERVFFVRDNGTGFDMRYVGKLFGVFQRLHSNEEFEGTGVGLAIVQRVVTRHGGRIWAEGAVNQGATFFFTLKTKPPAPL